jgi:hypothetical protein
MWAWHESQKKLLKKSNWQETQKVQT